MEAELTEPKTYTCANCGGTFEEGWTQEEADAEFAATFPGEKREDAAVLCDPCWNAAMAWAKSQGLVP